MEDSCMSKVGLLDVKKPITLFSETQVLRSKILFIIVLRIIKYAWWLSIYHKKTSRTLVQIVFRARDMILIK